MPKPKIFCQICEQEILEGELQVWLQTKIKEFDSWNFLEDLKFHNTCWVNKMSSIRKRGQEDVQKLIEKGMVEAGKFFGEGGITPVIR